MQISELFWKTYTHQYITAEGGVDYAFEEQGDTLFIFFEGSYQTIDWVNNFDFPARPYKGMDIPYRVHRGFLKCWKQVEDIVIEKITERKPDGAYKFKRIIVSGYSHGGALAAFCHECVWFHRADIRDNCWSYGFEGPRIYAGWKVKKELRERWAHFVLVRNNTDIVTHMPPYLFRFCHVGTVLHIGRFRDYSCVRSHYPDKVFASLKEINFNIF